MAAGNAAGHKKDGKHPLCGKDQVGYMWKDDKDVTCRACQLLLAHPCLELKEIVKKLEISN